MTTTENDVFRKIKELSARTYNPRPGIDIREIAAELSVSHASLQTWLDRLRQLKLVTYPGAQATIIKLTLLGTVVKK